MSPETGTGEDVAVVVTGATGAAAPVVSGDVVVVVVELARTVDDGEAALASESSAGTLPLSVRVAVVAVI